jgi:glycerate kinase
MRVLLAFDKFKDSLSARDACDIAARTLRGRHADWSFDLCPLADGGEGFAEILTAAAGGQLIASTVHGPRGDDAQAAMGLVPLSRIPAAAKTLLAIPELGPAARAPSVAVIEMASASGLALLAPERRDPWQASTYGTGELLRTAAELQVAAILLGVGGSATHDLGLGALAALGLEFFSAEGAAVNPIPAEWKSIVRATGRVSPPLPPVRIACDVTNPLLGSQGAAAVYGPQKGLRAADVKRLDHESARLALLLCNHTGKPDTLMTEPGTGAAGGISFGLMAAADAQLLPGFDLVTAWLDLDARLAQADLIITGEGRFDDSSLSGKGPGAVARRALALGKKVHVFAGSVTPTAAAPAGLALHAISPADMPLAAALPAAGANLRRVIATVL